MLAVHLAQLALDRLQLLAQEILALGLAHLLFGLRLDLAAELENFQLVRHVPEQPFQFRLRRVELEDLLPLLGGEPDVVGDVVREMQWIVDRAGRARELGGEVRRERDQLLERCDRAAHQSFALDREDVLGDLGMHLDRTCEIRLV